MGLVVCRNVVQQKSLEFMGLHQSGGANGKYLHVAACYVDRSALKWRMFQRKRDALEL